MATFWRLKRKDFYFTAIELKRIFPELRNSYTETIEGYLKTSNLEWYYKEKVKSPIWIRLTLPLAFVAMIVLFVLMPINYIVTGHWGYKYEPLTNWFRSLGF